MAIKNSSVFPIFYKDRCHRELWRRLGPWKQSSYRRVTNYFGYFQLPGSRQAVLIKIRRLILCNRLRIHKNVIQRTKVKQPHSTWGSVHADLSPATESQLMTHWHSDCSFFGCVLVTKLLIQVANTLITLLIKPNLLISSAKCKIYIRECANVGFTRL